MNLLQETPPPCYKTFMSVHIGVMELLTSILFIATLGFLPFSCSWMTTSATLIAVRTVFSLQMSNLSNQDSQADKTESLSLVPSSRVRLLGLCGGIGSGKSVACQTLVSELNCLARIDSDSIAHTVYEKGSDAIADLVEEFGSEVIDKTSGEIDRNKLGEIVFANQGAMKNLERLVWPHVQTKIISHIEKAKVGWEESGKMPIIVVEAAVLLDAGWQDFLDAVWVVSVSNDVAVRRLQEHRGLSIEEATKRVAAQQSRRGIGNLQEEIDKKVVSAVIDNRGTLDDLKQQLAEKLHDPTAWYERITENQQL